MRACRTAPSHKTAAAVRPVYPGIKTTPHSAVGTQNPNWLDEYAKRTGACRLGRRQRLQHLDGAARAYRAFDVAVLCVHDPVGIRDGQRPAVGRFNNAAAQGVYDGGVGAHGADFGSPPQGAEWVATRTVGLQLFRSLSCAG